MNKKIYIKVDFEDRHNAKLLGAKWCLEKKLWYFNSNCNNDKKIRLLELYELAEDS